MLRIHLSKIQNPHKEFSNSKSKPKIENHKTKQNATSTNS